MRAGHFHAVVADSIDRLTTDPARHGDVILAMALAVGPAAFLRQNTALINRTRDRRGLLAQYPHPVLVAYGANDVVCPSTMHAELITHRPDAELVAIAAAGHLATIDQPAACGELLAGWINQLSARATTDG